MRKLKMFVVLGLLQSFFMGAALAQVVHGTADEAKALVAKGLAHIKEVGVDRAAADFTAHGGGWQEKDLYIIIIKFDGTMVAHGGNKAMVGKNFIDMKDANGKLFTKDMGDIVKAKGSGWVDYLFTNPITKKTEQKSTFAERIPGYDGYIGVGIYK
ncbi:cache domain protein [mine drainage metagenome]|uniref:Cache domain protein n=1 Tax=mine drainage metagenome TaxID=410659 RepID=A0A1J5SFK4_9ZZZZ